MMTQDKWQKVEAFVKSKLSHDKSGHDMAHIQRVVALTRQIVQSETVNQDICLLAAYLHDVIDDKVVSDVNKAKEEVKSFLCQLDIEQVDIEQIMTIITTMSFSAQLEQNYQHTLESQVVQDADRLDALGAIGIARTFLYAGVKGSQLYNKSILPRTQMTKETYRNEESTAINHFYEKLLLLKDTMHTQTGKRIAKERHVFMENYLTQFLEEWDGLR